MLDWIDGFLRFRHGLPEPLLRWVDPGGQVPDERVRTALAVAVATFLAATAARLLLHLTTAIAAKVRGQALRQRTDPGLRLISGLAGFLAIATPWLALVLIRQTGEAVTWPYVAGLTGLLLWAVVRSVDAHVAWVDVRSRTVMLQRGLALGRIERVVVPDHQLVQRTADGTVPPTPHADAWIAIRRQFATRPLAERFLRDALQRLRLPWVALPPESTDPQVQ